MRALLSPHHPLQLVLGLLLWSLWFVLIYGGLSVACAFLPSAAQAGPFSLTNLLLGLSALLFMLATGWLGWRCWRAGQVRGQYSWQRFVALCGAGVHLIGLLATLFIAIPLFMLPPCI